MKKIIDLKKWLFKIDSLDYECEVTLPHSWNVDDNKEVQLYRGKAEYQSTIHIDDNDFEYAWLYFGCAYHTANVYVNNHLAGCHTGCGYTPFEFDIAEQLVKGENTIRVTIDNYKKPEMLPHMLDYDWSDDGGLTRNVTLTLAKSGDIHSIDLAYDLDEMKDGLCSGDISIYPDTLAEKITAEIIDSASGECVASGEGCGYVNIQFNSLRLWDTSSPALYTIRVKSSDDIHEVRTGFRKIEVKGSKVLLNGRELHMKGCEWMPGSHPDYGMAEPLEHSIKCLSQLKAAGCDFTRFHWQQDTSLFDWCDENGLLVQEEIPYWGHPKKATPMQLQIAKRQAEEMVTYHSHHPSIVFWGVGNELGGEFDETIDYVKQMYKYFNSLDGTRLVNYVSNSVCRDTNVDLDDATMYGDIAMWNEYLGLWQPCDDVEGVIKRTYNKFGDKPSMVTEFGLCEPAFDGGDERRAQILLERIPIYKALPNMCGYVWFSLNDYRTQCGEAGEGKFRQRVHGSTDLYANEKPSYQVFKNIK